MPSCLVNTSIRLVLRKKLSIFLPKEPWSIAGLEPTTLHSVFVSQSYMLNYLLFLRQNAKTDKMLYMNLAWGKDFLKEAIKYFATIKAVI